MEKMVRFFLAKESLFYAIKRKKKINHLKKGRSDSIFYFHDYNFQYFSFAHPSDDCTGCLSLLLGWTKDPADTEKTHARLLSAMVFPFSHCENEVYLCFGFIL